MRLAYDDWLISAMIGLYQARFTLAFLESRAYDKGLHIGNLFGIYPESGVKDRRGEAGKERN